MRLGRRLSFVIASFAIVGMACGTGRAGESAPTGFGVPSDAGACERADPDCEDTLPLDGESRIFDPVTGIEAKQIDGVWVFQYEPENVMDALHGGTPEIIDGCLLVDDAVIVWHVQRIEEAERAVAASLRGEALSLLVPGGGISLSEGGSVDQIPAVISDRCETSAVWFGAP